MLDCMAQFLDHLTIDGCYFCSRRHGGLGKARHGAREGMLFVLALLVLVCIRIWVVLPPRAISWPASLKTRKLAVFLGSGGHTTEALRLVSTLDFQRYTPRTYIISHGDHLSGQKAVELEASDASPQYRLLSVPRARRVHQSFFSTPATLLLSLCMAVYYVTLAPLLTRDYFADVLILNGPGTCLPLCMAVYLNRFLGLHSPKLIYIESFARVTTLSLSGKLLRPFVDRFVVQWPQLARNGGREEYRGWLI